MYDHNKAQQSKNRVHISWDILYINPYFAIHKRQNGTGDCNIFAWSTITRLSSVVNVAVIFKVHVEIFQ